MTEASIELGDWLTHPWWARLIRKMCEAANDYSKSMKMHKLADKAQSTPAPPQNDRFKDL